MEIKILNEDKLSKIKKCINKIINGFDDYRQTLYNPISPIIYHYTSFKNLFNILEGDSFWASRSRFSNDATEDQVLGEEWIKKEQYYGDNFIICFCNHGDILSQWRGYCPQGGVSIGFRFLKGYDTYTLFNALYNTDSPISGKYIETYKNFPLPVIYCDTKKGSGHGIMNDNIKKIFEEPEIKETDISLYDIMPYLKNGFFFEEQELRLVFNNSDSSLEKCIKFRKLEDGSMMPYIIVKYGNLLNVGRCLSITYKDKIDAIFNEHLTASYRDPIVIPCGRDQAEICAAFSEKIRIHKRAIFSENREFEIAKWENNPIQLICEGHLPIVSITVSPSIQQQHMKEVIERYCRSKYWLQNIEVNCSKIPYVASNM